MVAVFHAIFMLNNALALKFVLKHKTDSNVDYVLQSSSIVMEWAIGHLKEESSKFLMAELKSILKKWIEATRIRY